MAAVLHVAGSLTRLIAPCWQGCRLRNCDSFFSQNSCDLVLTGAQLDPATALRAVDMGPAADSPQAAAFRAFWGERAELRRFQVHLYGTATLHC